MTLGMVIVLAVILVALVIGLFSMMTDPKEVAAEEKQDVEEKVAAGVEMHDSGTLE